MRACLRLFLLSAVRDWVVATARGAVELARTERGEARTEHDCRMLLSYCRPLVEMRRDQEAHALCVEGLRLAGGLEVVLNEDGDPTGEFVDARTHEAMQRLLVEVKASLHMSSEEKAAAVKALFEQFDEDGDGFLNKLEYRNYLKVRTPIKLSTDCMPRYN